MHLPHVPPVCTLSVQQWGWLDADLSLAHDHRSTYIIQCLTLCNAVGEFRKLALLAEADGMLRQKLQQVLKLSKEKWDDARDHAMRAVLADSRMRVWCALFDRVECTRWILGTAVLVLLHD